MFTKKLDLDLEIFASTATRDNLHYTVVHQETDGDTACDGGQHGDEMLSTDGGDEKKEDGGFFI